MTHCTVEGCDKPIRSKGFCRLHYFRNWKHGSPLIVNKRGAKETGGLSNTPEYRAWNDMRRRCYTPTTRSYEYYGGRGITVCERWSDFSNFLEDMGKRPNSQYSLDRIDNDGNYEPSNCRWATWLEQASNKRSSKGDMCDGVTKRIRNGRTVWRARMKFNSVVVLNNEFTSYEKALAARRQTENYYCNDIHPVL